MGARRLAKLLLGINIRKIREGLPMGYDAYEEWAPRAPDRAVCTECVTDSSLAFRLESDANEEVACDYCGCTPAATLQTLVEWVFEGIQSEWTDPANELPFESAEGGYQGVVYSGYEIVMHETESWTDNDELREEVAHTLAGYFFSQKNYFMLRRDEALSFGWERFAEQVKHRTRYLFLQEDDADYHPDDIPPARMLDELGKEVREVGLLRTFDAGTEIVRVRVDHEKEVHTTPDALGTPKREYVRQPNRMSPAGIPMFYGAFDRDTALAETVNPKESSEKVATVGVWVPTRDLTVLDLTSIEPVPTLYDEERRHLRGAILFLHAFAGQMSQPIDGTEHIDYVPTQIVTEYFRHRFRIDGESVDGILYTSSRTGEPACVLFAENDDCGSWDGNPPCPTNCMLALLTLRTIRVDLTGYSAPV